MRRTGFLLWESRSLDHCASMRCWYLLVSRGPCVGIGVCRCVLWVRGWVKEWGDESFVHPLLFSVVDVRERGGGLGWRSRCQVWTHKSTLTRKRLLFRAALGRV